MTTTRPHQRTAKPGFVKRATTAVLLVQPVVFAIAVLLGRFVSYPTSIESLGRPMLVVAVGALFALMIARMLFGSWAWAAILSNAFVLLSLREPILGGVMVALALWWLLIRLARRIGHRGPPDVAVPWYIARAGGILSAAYLTVMALSAITAATDAPDVDFPSYSSTGSGGPNIYVVLLDGYPHVDTLERVFEIDSTDFIDSLNELGFDIATQARTNYNKTWLTLASMLNGAYIDDLLGDVPIPEEPSSQIRWLHSLIDRATLLDVLRQRGYTVRTVPPPFRSAALTSADETIGAASVTEFEAHLIREAPWTLLLQDSVRALLSNSQRAQVTHALDTVSRLSGEAASAKPQFVLAHVQSPHTPFVLGDVPSSESLNCFPVLCSFWSSTLQELRITFPVFRDGLATQISELNELVIEAVRNIATNDPQAVVIVMSDHGSRYSLADPAEHYRSFLAVRSPRFAGLYPEDESPVNILRGLFSAYFGADLDRMPYRAWISDWSSQYLRLEPLDITNLR